MYPNNNLWLELKSPLEINGLALGVNFPEIGLPHKIEQSDKDTYLVGYFTSFEDGFDEKNLLNGIKKSGLKRIVNSNSLFLLFLFDGQNQTLTVAVDQFLSFPCYFSFINGKLIFSSAFGPIRNELRKTQKLKIDMDPVLSYLLLECPNTDHTMVNQIKVLPGGCKATFDLNSIKNYQIETQIEVDSFYKSIPIKKYSSLESFSKDWLSLLMEVIERRVKQIPSGFKVGCDVSSGFDCALVAYCLSQTTPPGSFTGYSNYSSVMGDENNIEVAKRFAKLHHFPLEEFDYTRHTKHETKLDNAWADDPLQPFVYVHHQPYINFLSDRGIKILFTGEFGDEAYDMKNMGLFSYFPVQSGYFNSISSLKRHQRQDLFTENYRNIFLDQQRFRQRGYFPLIVTEKSAACYMPIAEAYGNWGINRLHVFNDTRLLSLSTQAPLPKGAGSDQLKELLMPHYKSIMPENYYATSNACEPFVYFFVNQKSFVDTVLNNSALAEMGLINAEHIRKLVHEPQSEIYANKDHQRAVQIYELLKLDWYLQKNDLGL